MLVHSTLVTGNRTRLYGALIAAAAFAALAAIYVRTLLPGPVGGDAGELQYAGPLLALVHPTGQPLYVSMGYVWSRLIPIGSAAYRMNLLAAACAAAACGTTAWALYALYRRPAVALAGGLTLGLGATFWSQAVIADKYAFSAFFAALVTALALVWVRARARPGSDRWLYALSCAYGLGLLHHRSLLAFAPGLALLVLLHERGRLWRNWRRTLLCLALVLLPALVVYPLFLPWAQSRQLSPLLWQPHSAGDWLDWMLERHVIAGEVLNFDTTGDTSLAARIGMYAQTLLADYTLPVLLIAAWGAVAMAARDPAAGLFLVGTFALAGALGANFRGNERQFTYYLPSFVVLIYAYGAGLAAGWEMLSAWLRGKRWPARLAAAAGIALMIAVAVSQFLYAYPARRIDAVYGQPLDVWRQTLKTGTQGARLAELSLPRLAPDPIVLADWEQATVLWYYRHVEGVRPDMQVTYPIDRLDEAMASGRPVYLARTLAGAGKRYPLSMAGPLIAVLREPETQAPPDATPLGAVFSDTLALAAYRYELPVPQGGGYLPVTFFWQAQVVPADDYSLSLRLLAGDGSVVWSQDQQHPVLGTYPTHLWSRGQVVADYYEVPLPRELPAGDYHLGLIVYTRTPDGGFVNLRVGSGEQLELPAFRVGP